MCNVYLQTNKNRLKVKNFYNKRGKSDKFLKLLD